MSKQQHSPTKVVLVAHRDIQLVEDIAKQCALMGMQVVTAGDTMTAVKMMDKCIPDLLIIDRDLPAINNRSFLDVWQMQDESSKTPSIILCQAENLSEIPRLPRILAYYCSTSPYRWKTLEMFINELVDMDPDIGDESFVSQNFNTDHEE